MLKAFKILSKKQKILVILMFLLYIAAWGVLGFVLGERSVPVAAIGSYDNKNAPKVADTPNPINGILYTKDEAKIWANNLPLAVIIENSTDARPQTGLTNADIVYETLAEGGITRLTAVFLANDSDLGPVRSNRPYFLDWVSEYSAGYAHIGGSPLGQQLVKDYGIKDLDQFYLGSPTYERISSRPAPHNVYTTTKKLRDAASGKGYKGPVKIDSWLFADSEAPVSERPKTFTISLGFLGAGGYDVTWSYDSNSNTYLRTNGGDKFIDVGNNQQVSAKNILVQYVQIRDEGSGHGRILVQNEGSGDAVVFRDGIAIVGKWKKDGRTSRTRFYDKDNKEITLNRGQIWVEAVPTGSAVTYK
jgi:hypothetical protein